MRIIFLLLIFPLITTAQDTLPLRGLAIGAPHKEQVDTFVRFIEEDLGPRNINTLILRIGYNYQFTSHPELVDDDALSKADVDRIVTASKKNGISLVPLINLLGHQSWAGSVGKLLEVYPEFDETPGVTLPEDYAWPNEDSLYCKSYCPLHPEVHDILFEVIDEITEVFQTDAFHAGMDEVFYIGDPDCPRCKGKDKAGLFADEVTRINDHLKESGKRLWIWGDRLLDGKTTGLGMWEASMNGTAKAIHLIPRDVMICDWHYERADPTAVYFAMNGFDVATCAWKEPEVAREQTDILLQLRESATPVMKPRYRGMILTVWSGTEDFLNSVEEPNKTGQAAVLDVLFPGK